MKHTLLLFLLALMTASTVHAQQATASSPATGSADEIIELKELTFNFGKIPQGRPVTHQFELVNKGKEPLLLENVQASCGCTTPEWNQAPIAPGGSSVIKVGFNAASEGHFAKTVSIIYKGGSQVKTFTISGDVYPAPTTSAPLNSSLSLIK